jgi:hypothetical protein
MTPGELFVFSAVGGVVVSGVLFLVFSAFAGGLLVLVRACCSTTRCACLCPR